MITGFRYRNDAPPLEVPLFERIESNEFAELHENRKIREVFFNHFFPVLNNRNP